MNRGGWRFRLLTINDKGDQVVSSPTRSVPGPTDPWPVDAASARPNRRQRVFAEWLADVLIYTAVLNLFVEFHGDVAIDSFVISMLAALMLKVLLVAIATVKKGVWKWAQAKGSRRYTIAGALGVWLILFLSKFLILGAEDLIFGDSVELGGFVVVMFLAASLTIARELIQRTYLWLGDTSRN